MTAIDFSSLELALAQLEKSLRYLGSQASQDDPDLREQFRAAVIQAFEYTYELSFKMIRRELEQIVANPGDLREMAFKDVMRTAADANLIRDPKMFLLYREKRNLTSHTYDPTKAEEVLEDMDAFVSDVRYVIEQLRRRNLGTAH